MKGATLTVLVENTAQGHGLLAEHGLSFWIETGARRILFDTGQTGIIAHNAGLLGIDLSSADALILSHGHYDHTGGIAAVAWPRPKDGIAARPAYLHPRALESKYARNADGKGRYIGISAESARALHESFEMMSAEAPTEIGDGFSVTGSIPRITDFEDTGGPFFKDAECREPDELVDDQAAFLETASGTVVILGCAHAGIVNTLSLVNELVPKRPIHTVIGGTHLVGASEKRMNRTVEALRVFGVQLMFPLHCTGFDGAARLWNEFPGRVSICPVGTRLELPA